MTGIGVRNLKPLGRDTSRLREGERRCELMIAAPESQHRLIRRFLWQVAASLVFIGAILFGAAGTLNWPAAWTYLGLTAIMSFGLGFGLLRHDPGLLNERLGSPFQRDQKDWDKALMLVLLASWIAWLAVMGLDAGRYHWSHMPPLVRGTGLVLIGLGSYIVWLTLKANSYAAPVVKIQRARGHLVVTTGPYAYIRHPMYAGALLVILGVPLWLGSWWGLIAGLGLVGIIAIRAVLEERSLTAELEGYASYAARTPYRLVPYLW
jgi:protein-S-isoprenylcysteine O-methyltransferase Ste14